MYFVNGQQRDVFTLDDRSFNYGDGCFTTMLVESGAISLWPQHQARMSHALQRLSIPELNWQEVHTWINQAISIYHAGRVPQLSGVKLHVSRGTGGRGYSPREVENTQVTIHPFDYPCHYRQWQVQGISLGVSSLQLGLNPMLAGLKHNNRLEQVLIKAEIDKQKYDDHVVLDINHHVIEASASNLFWVKDQCLYTADLSRSGVAGILREQVLTLTERLSMKSKVGSFTLEHLTNADEVFITNALHGVVPVTSIDTRCFQIGTITRAFQESLNP
ncbi:aminodeoxychorismate lyase [Vibrio rumoiensis]|uniref:Aminodeoxychorismate lyase n=1 Tax=Vibrio rumoiensis 1S-45 TaxID=1188252 RepID=A0A1E5E445_9VIBR|nr:aminodeoxychorismate lyase [Vibrio rumoiensis]OEF26928.1 aminodeoxychorismate lyase [Vibrio rumoiensis 1S-45]